MQKNNFEHATISNKETQHQIVFKDSIIQNMLSLVWMLCPNVVGIMEIWFLLKKQITWKPGILLQIIFIIFKGYSESGNCFTLL